MQQGAHKKTTHNPPIKTGFKDNTSAMLLGSGELGKEVAIELMRMGVYVIACDRYDNAPAMQVAHERLVFDMRNGDLLRQAIDKHMPAVVIPEIEAISTETLVELEKSRNLHVVPSANAANITMNRESIRTLAAEKLKLPTSKYFFASSIEEIQANIGKVGFPCVMKPIMSSSGKGQSTLKGKDDIKTSYEYACSAGRGGMTRVIVEGMVEFEKEITLLTVSACDGIHFCEPIGHHQVNGDYQESWQPEPLSAKVLSRCKEIATTVVKSLGGWGIFGVELFICKDQVLFSELSPRPHDTGMVTMISQDLSEFALHVRAFMGLPVGKIGFFGPSASAALSAHGHGDKIAFKDVDRALAVSNYSAVRIFDKPVVEGERRVGVALCRAKTVDKAVERAKIMRNKIKIEVSE